MDLRGWIKDVDGLGKLKVIRGAHWDLELGGITELAVRKKASPTLLFDDIVDYPSGYRVVTNTLTHASEDPVRVAVALGLSGDVASTRELVYKIKERLPKWEADAKTCNPVSVENGPVMEEGVPRDEDVDMLKFPSHAGTRRTVVDISERARLLSLVIQKRNS